MLMLRRLAIVVTVARTGHETDRATVRLWCLVERLNWYAHLLMHLAVSVRKNTQYAGPSTASLFGHDASCRGSGQPSFFVQPQLFP